MRKSPSFSRILSIGSIWPIWCALVLSIGGAFAQSDGPQPLPMPAQIAAPKDTPYLGAIRLSVDATDLERHIFSVRESVPVRAGESIVLLYPQWLPGEHSPSGGIDALAGLMIYANGARVEWQRDPVNVFAFHVAYPRAPRPWTSISSSSRPSMRRKAAW